MNNMTPKDYIQDALRTEPTNYLFGDTGSMSKRTEHAIMGLVTESGEMMDQVKKVKLYGKEVDRINLIEEAGDIMWYLAILASSLDVSFEEIWQKNIDKLRARFPEKFDAYHALDRNISNERRVLEE